MLELASIPEKSQAQEEGFSLVPCCLKCLIVLYIPGRKLETLVTISGGVLTLLP